eukprot:3374784-Amphidinium_carterae.2
MVLLLNMLPSAFSLTLALCKRLALHGQRQKQRKRAQTTRKKGNARLLSLPHSIPRSKLLLSSRASPC